jgi:hypothetical protein
MQHCAVLIDSRLVWYRLTDKIAVTRLAIVFHLGSRDLDRQHAPAVSQTTTRGRRTDRCDYRYRPRWTRHYAEFGSDRAAADTAYEAVDDQSDW